MCPDPVKQITNRSNLGTGGWKEQPGTYLLPLPGEGAGRRDPGAAVPFSASAGAGPARTDSAPR